jgi:hypothetical protein
MASSLARSAGDIQQADTLLCESWNERMWSDGDRACMAGDRTAGQGRGSNQASDKLLSESRNERTWTDGEPIDLSPTIYQAVSGRIKRVPALDQSVASVEPMGGLLRSIGLTKFR